MLPANLPERTLGWIVLDWITKYLAQPDGKRKGQSFKLTPEQAMFVVWFYAIDDTGSFVYRNAVLERPKGWGKSPLLAALSCAEFMGPVRFSHWDSNGNPVAVQCPSALIQICAISDDQVENTYALCREMMLDGRFRQRYPEVEVMLAKTTAPGGRTMKKVTASPRGREGQRVTFVVMDETHLWVPAEQGPELYEALVRNLAKMDCRHIETTNAPVPGEGSVAEASHDAYEKMLAGDAFDMRLLFDTREVFVEDIYDPITAIPALKKVYGDAAHPVTGWINLDRIWAEINDPRTKEHTARRFYFNQRTSGHSGWLDKRMWMKCRDDTLRLKKSDRIALGFVGKSRNGATCLVACRLIDGALFNMGWWEKPEGAKEWEVPFTKVTKRVNEVMEKYDVYKFLANPDGGFQDIIGRWASKWNGEDKEERYIEEWWLRSKLKMTQAVEQFEKAVESLRVKFFDEDISRHVLQCHTEETTDGVILRQETKYTQLYISGAQAAVLAFEAAAIAIAEGALDRNKSNGIYGF